MDIHRASYAEHLRSEKHSENLRQDDIIIPNWLFKREETPTKNENQKI